MTWNDAVLNRLDALIGAIQRLGDRVAPPNRTRPDALFDNEAALVSAFHAAKQRYQRFPGPTEKAALLEATGRASAYLSDAEADELREVVAEGHRRREPSRGPYR